MSFARCLLSPLVFSLRSSSNKSSVSRMRGWASLMFGSIINPFTTFGPSPAPRPTYVTELLIRVSVTSRPQSSRIDRLGHMAHDDSCYTSRSRGMTSRNDNVGKWTDLLPDDVRIRIANCHTWNHDRLVDFTLIDNSRLDQQVRRVWTKHTHVKQTSLATDSHRKGSVSGTNIAHHIMLWRFTWPDCRTSLRSLTWQLILVYCSHRYWSHCFSRCLLNADQVFSSDCLCKITYVANLICTYGCWLAKYRSYWRFKYSII